MAGKPLMFVRGPYIQTYMSWIAKYNYTPPTYFAVHDADYKNYPFQGALQALAQDRNNNEVVALLDDYATNTSLHKFEGDDVKNLFQ
jgi:hypothetical protein